MKGELRKARRAAGTPPAVILPSSAPSGAQSLPFYRHGVIFATVPTYASTQHSCHHVLSEPSRTSQGQPLPPVQALPTRSFREGSQIPQLHPISCLLGSSKAIEKQLTMTPVPATLHVPQPQKGQGFGCCSATQNIQKLPTSLGLEELYLPTRPHRQQL